MKILNLAWNDVRIYFSERSTVFFFLILPVVFTAILGVSLGGASDPNADPRIPVLVVDRDTSSLSKQLRASLEASDVIRPIFATGDEAERLFEEEEAPALLSVRAGFGESLHAGEPVELKLHTASNDNRTLAVERAIQAAASEVGSSVAAALTSVEEAERIRPFESQDAQQAYFDQGLEMAQEVVQDPPARVETTRGAAVSQQTADGFEQSSSGQLVTWVLITLLGASDVFVNERVGGTLRRLVVTPASRGTILAGKIAGRLGMGILQMVLLIGIGALAFGVNWGRSPAALASIVLSFGLAAVALGVAVGAFARTRRQAGGLTILLAMLLASLGGAWWPLEITPDVYQQAVKVLPSTWAVLGFQDVIVRGQGVAGVLPEAGILLAFAAVFFTVGIWRFQFE